MMMPAESLLDNHITKYNIVVVVVIIKGPWLTLSGLSG